jgi:phage tail sheath protein FI
MGQVEAAMAEFTHPGVYVEEGPAGAPIEGVDTSRPVFLGHAEKAPAWRKPLKIESLAAFQRKLGGPVRGCHLHAALSAWFVNGGGAAIVLPLGPCDPAARDPAPLLAGLDRAGKESGVSLLLVPDALRLARNDCYAVQQAMLEQCARLRDRFAILDIHGGGDPAARTAAGSAPLIAAFRAAVEPLGKARSWGAAYYPWLIDAAGKAVPPSAAVAGIFARTDRGRGPWKAPAGVEASLRAAEVAVRYTDRQLQDLHSPAQGPSIDPIRRFGDGGPCVWGARTLDAEGGEWRYVPVRRTAILIEQSLRRGLQWAVFERNEAATWLAVRRAAENFLHTLFRQGAFQGAKPQEAYYVKCGLGQTMTASDIANGRLICEIGFAPLKPAEFVILRISQLMRAPDE